MTLPPSRLLAARAGVGARAPIVDITFADDPNKLCDRIKIIPRFDGFATSRQDAIAIFGNDPSNETRGNTAAALRQLLVGAGHGTTGWVFPPQGDLNASGIHKLLFSMSGLDSSSQ